ncbi:DUF4241 domain-containing protein [Streptomyces sp. NPDC003863]
MSDSAARLVVCDTQAVTWELALVPDGDPVELGEGENFGYDEDV